MTGLRRLRTAFDAGPPFQMAMLLIGICRGVSYITDFLPASVAERALPHWVLLLFLIELTLGAATGLISVLIQHPMLERRGLILYGWSALVYAIVLEVQRPRPAALSFVIYASISVACWLRIRQMSRIDAVLREQLGGGR